MSWLNLERSRQSKAGQIVVRMAHAGAREAAVNLPETLRPPLGSMAYATRGVAVSMMRPPSAYPAASDAADPGGDTDVRGPSSRLTQSGQSRRSARPYHDLI